jgi:hypothetical protein
MPGVGTLHCPTWCGLLVSPPIQTRWRTIHGATSGTDARSTTWSRIPCPATDRVVLAAPGRSGSTSGSSVRSAGSRTGLSFQLDPMKDCPSLTPIGGCSPKRDSGGSHCVRTITTGSRPVNAARRSTVPTVRRLGWWAMAPSRRTSTGAHVLHMGITRWTKVRPESNQSSGGGSTTVTTGSAFCAS